MRMCVSCLCERSMLVIFFLTTNGGRVVQGVRLSVSQPKGTRSYPQSLQPTCMRSWASSLDMDLNSLYLTLDKGAC